MGAREAAGQLTTHVLDTANGKPAAQMRVDLFQFEGDRLVRLCTIATNDDGRCAVPLLAGTAMQVGPYELHFHVGDYFEMHSFLNIVPVRFVISSAEAHYHVPLLVSPYAYSTYRGS